MQARQLPEHNYFFQEQDPIVQQTNDSHDETNPFLDLPLDVLKDCIQYSMLLFKFSCTNLQQQDLNQIMKNLLELQKSRSCLKNDNSEKVKMIRQYKQKSSWQLLIHHVQEHKIDLSKMDLSTQNIYPHISQDVHSWKQTDVRYLEIIMLQNQILLVNLEELKK